jgi:hypothetical protein
VGELSCCSLEALAAHLLPSLNEDLVGGLLFRAAGSPAASRSLGRWELRRGLGLESFGVFFCGLLWQLSQQAVCLELSLGHFLGGGVAAGRGGRLLVLENRHTSCEIVQVFGDLIRFRGEGRLRPSLCAVLPSERPLAQSACF